ncbi:MAG: hypothetical protein VXV96_00800 [Bdellovibrionota bacterium]|nr:hypothetical protein [Bdellovibrionota bacterium]
MSLKLALSGIYDQRTVSFLAEKNIDFLCFDLRPRSLNFIQEYRLLEMAQAMVGGVLVLQFSQEKDFIIHRLIKSVREVFSGEILLYFCADEADEFCNSFGVGYLKKISGNGPMPLPQSYLKGVVFSHHYLDYLGDNGVLQQFAARYYQTFSQQSIDLYQILEGDWDSNYRPSLCDLFDLDYLMLPINQKVEVCFRNVDLNGLEASLRSVPKTLL